MKTFARGAGGERLINRPERNALMYHRILVPLDGSATAERGLREAIGLAAQHKSRLVVIHVVDDFSSLVELSSVASYERMKTELGQFGNALLEKARLSAAGAGVQVETSLIDVTDKRISTVIIDQAVKSGCDLIVMGTHGRRGFSRLTMGSEAELVARSSAVPVMLVKLERSQSEREKDAVSA